MANGAEGNPLIIRDLKFLGGIATPRGWRPPTTLPEIAFSGRSNVGKSSLLNTLVQRKALARVSQTPGKTREINLYGVNDAFVLVDLPGYGYAQISKSEREQWRPLIEGYLRQSEQLHGVVQLVDARHDPTALDQQMLAFLAELGAPTIVALTKVDKLRASERAARLASTVQQLELDEEQVIPFSSETKEGRDELARAIVSLVQQPSWRAPR